MKKRIIVAALAAVCLLTGSSLYAQINFGITPIRAEHEGKAGEIITEAFHIRNNADGPIRVRVYAENWFLNDDGTPSFVGDQRVEFSCKDWIKVNPQDFRLNPNEIKMVRYSILIPEDAGDAGYHASISFENVPMDDPSVGGSRVVFTGKIAAAVYVKVGSTQPEAEIEDLLLMEHEGKPALSLRIKNTGNTYFRTSGQIEISRGDGKRIMEIEIPGKVSLQGQEIYILCPLEKPLSPGHYSVFCKLDIGRRELIGFKKELDIQNEY